jgi:hypothetical protein
VRLCVDAENRGLAQGCARVDPFLGLGGWEVRGGWWIHRRGWKGPGGRPGDLGAEEVFAEVEAELVVDIAAATAAEGRTEVVVHMRAVPAVGFEEADIAY